MNQLLPPKKRTELQELSNYVFIDPSSSEDGSSMVYVEADSDFISTTFTPNGLTSVETSTNARVNRTVIEGYSFDSPVLRRNEERKTRLRQEYAVNETPPSG